MSDPLSLGVSVGGVADAIATLQRLGGAIGAAGQSVDNASRNNTQNARSASDARGANEGFGNSAQQVAQRVQGMASQVASLSGRLGGGGIGQAAGLVASLAGVTANALAMGATMGPGGIVVGAVSGLLPLMADWLGTNDRVAVSISHLSAEQRDFTIATAGSVTAIRQYIAAAHDMAEAEATRARIEAGRGTVDEQFAAANLAGARVGELRTQRSEIDGRIRALQEELRAVDTGTSRAELAQLQAQSAQIGQQITTAHAESERLGGLARAAEAVAAASARQQAAESVDAQQQGISDAIDRKAAQDAARSGSGAGAAASAAQASKQGAFERMSARDRRDLLGYEEPTAEGHGAVDALMSGNAGSATGFADVIHGIRDQEHADAQRQLADFEESQKAQRDLAQAAQDASHAFESGYVNSIETVIAAWRRANVELGRAGQQMISQSRLLERGIQASGNSIVDVVGSQMTGAFQSAVGAWLDGSMTFVQAAEAMAKGVLKSLTTEAIVQTVVELARAAAAAAGSYGTDPAVEMHLVAAGLWAAVGGVAGAVGASVGAFGGGQKAGSGATSHDTANASREHQQQPQQGPINFYVYPGGYITKLDVSAGIAEALNHGARNGITLNPGVIRRAA